MKDIIDKDTGAIKLGELSKYNGLSEFENMKLVVSLLATRYEFYGEPKKITVTFPKGDLEL